MLEQNYRADPISESLLLSLKGKTVDFLVQRENKQVVVTGKIIRSGYTPHNYMESREKDWGSRSFITQETLEIAGGARAPHSHSLSPQQMPRFLIPRMLGRRCGDRMIPLVRLPATSIGMMYQMSFGIM